MRIGVVRADSFIRMNLLSVPTKLMPMSFLGVFIPP